MLVLARKQNEKIVIGDDVTVTVVSIRNGVVRLGIEAPGEMPVHRDEIARAIQREGRELTRARRIVCLTMCRSDYLQ